MYFPLLCLISQRDVFWSYKAKYKLPMASSLHHQKSVLRKWLCKHKNNQPQYHKILIDTGKGDSHAKKTTLKDCFKKMMLWPKRHFFCPMTTARRDKMAKYRQTHFAAEKDQTVFNYYKWPQSRLVIFILVKVKPVFSWRKCIFDNVKKEIR